MATGIGQSGSWDPGHETDIPHRKFIENSNDENLYINLYDLPEYIRKVKFDNTFKQVKQTHEAGVPLPIFIAAPWVSLKSKICLQDSLEVPKNFLQEHDYTPIDRPVPPALGCFVCDAVVYLQKECYTLQDALLYLNPLRQDVIFAIIREINRRLRPKIFPISQEHLDQHSRFSYIEMANTDQRFLFPLERELSLAGEVDWSLKRRYVDEWTNGFMYLIRKDLDNRGLIGHIGCFTWMNLIWVLRCAVRKFLPQELIQGEKNRTFFLDAIQKGHNIVTDQIKKLTNAIVESAIALKTAPSRRRSSPYEMRLQLMRACENILTMNLTQIFYAEVNVESSIFHYKNHAEKPEECLCRFYRSLKGTNLEPITEV
ncbi:hypothetical protein Aperf_G00000124245 [Anoplocephala perfoliata]